MTILLIKGELELPSSSNDDDVAIICDDDGCTKILLDMAIISLELVTV